MPRITSGLAGLAVMTSLTACATALPATPGLPGSPGITGAGITAPARAGASGDFLVFYADGKRREALAAIGRAGGSAVRTEERLGYVQARAVGERFAAALDADPAIVGVTADRRIGFATARPAKGAAVPDISAREGRPKAGEPLAGRQWDMRMIGADLANAAFKGSRKVLVGVIDTGIDGNHPDIAPNFNRGLSRNFVTDRPKDQNGETLDGACEVASCQDPVDRDDDGHGTHVASTIASPVNGVGIAGVAPGVQLVNLRAGQDSGFFFLKPSLDALTYAADIGVDVVNMSYYVDPWLYNCTNNAADSERERSEQRAVVTGMQRALDYARGKGVTLISALGNGSADLGKPKLDKASPGYPRGDERVRRVDNSCLNVPAESGGVISITALGPSGRKAIYSDYGLEQADLSAPGGDALDGPTVSPTRSILAAAPESALRAAGKLDRDGRPKNGEVLRDCAGGACSYYQYLDGTSMAAPHATGVAALLISRFGKPGKGGLELDPATVEKLLYKTATPRPCPSPRAYVYRVYGEAQTHTCEGGKDKNGFYGHGLVNALNATTAVK
ncbi:S8 family peptidase [Nonomuraea typhae]|uniref:S8 family peptidase n=1 Tax=Nonomuraea typhae TaxID=2603600 RepID=UPI0012FBBD14|nr:S8 family serine peptidase [Nonomuraea typhae]